TGQASRRKNSKLMKTIRDNVVFFSRATRLVFLLILFSVAVTSATAQAGTQSPRSQAPAGPQPAVRDVTYQSAALGRAMKYRILLPAGYDHGVLRYPVLYLLHGLMGS